MLWGHQRKLRFPDSIHGWFYVSPGHRAELPHQATISRRWPDGRNPALITMWHACWRELSPTPRLCRSAVLRHLRFHQCPLPLHCWSSTEAAEHLALWWFYSSVQWSLSWELKGQCSSEVKQTSELHGCPSATLPKTLYHLLTRRMRRSTLIMFTGLHTAGNT